MTNLRFIGWATGLALACGALFFYLTLTATIASLEPEGCAIHVETDSFGETERRGARWAEKLGLAEQHGNWMVLDQKICPITLPNISSPHSISEPRIVALFGSLPDQKGCFYQGTPLSFMSFAEYSNEDDAFKAYMGFMGAGILSGDIRFYEDSPLNVPDFRIADITTCPSEENGDVLATSHAAFAENFDRYVRILQARQICGDKIDTGQDYVALQEQPNAWMSFELMWLTMAAGWYEGMSYPKKGQPRPPLCHVP